MAGTSEMPSKGEPARVGDRLVAESNPAAAKRSNLLAYVAVFAALLAFSGALNFAIVQRAPTLPMADGVMYLDAFDKARQGIVTREGDDVGLAARSEWFCDPRNAETLEAYTRLLLAPGETPRYASAAEACADVSANPLKSTAWIHPPTYFALTAWLSDLATAVVPSIEPSSAGRAQGVLWFAIGGTLLVWVAHLWGARRTYATVVLMALATTPGFVAVFGYITPDVTFLAVGAGLIAGATLWWRDQMARPWLIALGLLAAIIKQTLTLSVAAAVLLLVVLQWQTKKRSWGQVITASALLLGGATAGVLGWELVQRTVLAGTPTALAEDPYAMPADVNGLMGLVFTGATQFTVGDVIELAREPWAAQGIAAIATVAIFAASLGLLFYGSRRDELLPMAAAGLLVVGLGGAAVSLAYAASGGVVLPPAPRYVFGGFAALVVPLLVLARLTPIWITSAALALLGLLSWWYFPLT